MNVENNQDQVKFMKEAIEEAKKSKCSRRKCGSILVKDGAVIGRGYNSPPANKESQRRCSTDKDIYHKKVTDKTCCVHAEQRAIIDALKNNKVSVQDSQLYFANIDDNGDIIHAGEPYCTICSKLALDVGISKFILWHKEGIHSYNIEEYNLKSFEYKG